MVRSTFNPWSIHGQSIVQPPPILLTGWTSTVLYQLRRLQRGVSFLSFDDPRENISVLGYAACWVAESDRSDWIDSGIFGLTRLRGGARVDMYIQYEYARHFGGSGRVVVPGNVDVGVWICGYVAAVGAWMEFYLCVPVCTCTCMYMYLYVPVSTQVLYAHTVQVWYIHRMYVHVQCCMYCRVPDEDLPISPCCSHADAVLGMANFDTSSFFPIWSFYASRFSCFSCSHALLSCFNASPASHASKTGARTEPRPIRMEAAYHFAPSALSFPTSRHLSAFSSAQKANIERSIIRRLKI